MAKREAKVIRSKRRSDVEVVNRRPPRWLILVGLAVAIGAVAAAFAVAGQTPRRPVA